MRVLHLASGNMYGGVETFLTTLLREAWRAPAMEPDFAVCFEGRFRSELELLGCTPHRLPPARLSRPHSVLRARRALADLLRRESFDLVVCHQPWVCVLFASVIRAADLPLVLWVHMAGNGQHWLERLCRFTRPDVALCNSQFAAAETSRWLEHTLIEHVYYPVPSPSTRPRAERSQIRADLETAAGEIVITQISRLEPWKGQHVLLSSLGMLRDVPGWTCWLVGGPQRLSEARYFAKLKDAAKLNGIESRVRFLGERRDVPAILNAADLFCQPNTTPEPFGLSLVEAQHAGLPVVTSEIGGACEVVDGTCGVLIAPGDAAALSAALRRLLLDRDLRARLSVESRRRADALCNASRQIRRIELALARIVGAPRVMRPRPAEAGLP